MFFFLSDLNIFCLLFTTLASAPLTNQFYQRVVFFFLKEKLELNLAGRKAKLSPVITKAVLWSTKPCGAVANTCVLSSRTVGGFCFLFSFFQSAALNGCLRKCHGAAPSFFSSTSRKLSII